MNVEAPTVPDIVEPPRVQQKPILRDYVETILVCVIFVIFSRAFVFQQSKMKNTDKRDNK